MQLAEAHRLGEDAAAQGAGALKQKGRACSRGTGAGSRDAGVAIGGGCVAAGERRHRPRASSCRRRRGASWMPPTVLPEVSPAPEAQRRLSCRRTRTNSWRNLGAPDSAALHGKGEQVAGAAPSTRAFMRPVLCCHQKEPPILQGRMHTHCLSVCLSLYVLSGSWDSHQASSPLKPGASPGREEALNEDGQVCHLRSTPCVSSTLEDFRKVVN